jgi:hypothetical protein
VLQFPRRRTLGAVAAAFALAFGGIVTAATPASAAPGWTHVKKRCVVRNPAIKENSGMARSTYRRPVLFAHNDSGGGPQFFALGRRCGTRAVFDLPGAPASDWEDMAAGRRHALWFGDIGGNSPRSQINVIKVREPKRLKSRDLRYTAYRLAYPDGAHDAESLMVKPGNGRLFIVTKSGSGAAIYRAPKRLDPGTTNKLRRVASAPSFRTGADFSRSGKYFVLRGYTDAFVYRSLHDDKPVEISIPKAQTGGEAVAFGRGRALYFGAEGVRQWLWKARP